MSISMSDLREVPLPKLLTTMEALGLSINGISSRSAALTKLVANAIALD